jgi:hypothetical protein
MAEFTDSEREWHSEMRSLTRDEHGREVLVGLTFEETDFYVTYLRTRHTAVRGRGDRDRFLELHQRHEIERHQVLAAEIYLRRENPSRQ